MTTSARTSYTLSRRGLIQGALAAAPLAVLVGSERASAADEYSWRNVQIGGGGYVVGLVSHPREKNLVYIRTDVGGVYRWNERPDATSRYWTPLNDGIPIEQWNYYGVESIALDPLDPNVVYAALGKFPWAGKGRVFRSGDRGTTWEPLALEVTMHSNGPLRSGGERLLVHPGEPNIIFFGSRKDGLWRSTDGGASWSQILPERTGEEGLGVSFVHIDAPRGDEADVYAGVTGKGLLHSRDGGERWHDIAGPKVPMRAATAGDRALIVTAEDGVYRYAGGNWSNITPNSQHKYSAIAIDPTNPDVVVVAANENMKSLPIFISQDGGSHWIEFTQQNGRAVPRGAVPWWPKNYFASAVAAALIDPHTPGRLWFADWYGVWRTDDLLKDEQVWVSYIRGLEETVVMTLATPPIGAPLLSGVGDNNGFLHHDLDEFPPTNFQGVSIWNTLGIDHHEANPRRLVRVGVGGKHRADDGGVGVSEDGGETWRQIDWPFGPVSKVAYSATDPNVIIALPFNAGPKVTHDLGVSWLGPDDLVKEPPIKRVWEWGHPLAADRVDGRTFYLFAAGEFFHTLDAGETWTKTAKLPASSAPMVECGPGLEGVVWISLDGEGLYASRDRGRSFAKIDGIDRARLFSFGKNALGAAVPSVFLYGRLTGASSEAIYRSDDMGANWARISISSQRVGDQPNIMRGDRQVFGRVFIGTNGRGVFVGEPTVSDP